LRPIRSILEKAKGLVFIQPALGPVITGIEQELNRLPKAGYMEGHEFHALVGILNTLSNLDNINTVEVEQIEQEVLPPGLDEKNETTMGTIDDKEKLETKGSDVDIENIFEPLSELNQQTVVSRPIVWF
jgi:hypothetical protein